VIRMRAAVSAVPLRHIYHYSGGAESDASHELTLQSEQLVEYRGDVVTRTGSSWLRLLAKHEVPGFRCAVTLRAAPNPLDVAAHWRI